MGMKDDDLNVDLNLTSMIDLMSVLVAFLLVTAVWLHIAAIQTKVESKGRAPLAVTPPKNNQIEVRVTRSGYRIKWPPIKGLRLDSFLNRSKGNYNRERLSALISKAVARRKGLRASVTGNNNVEYGAVAESIDAVKAGGIASVALATN